MSSPFNNLAYCPIDLPRIVIDEQLIRELVDKNDTGHHDGLWKCLPLIGRVTCQEDFRNSAEFEIAWENRYHSTRPILINEAIYSPLKALFDHFEKLPLTITHAQILNQLADVGKHYDLKHYTGVDYIDDTRGINLEIEPAGYKVLLNAFTEKSFYVAEGFGKPNNYIVLPPETNTFVINELSFPHGAKKPPRSKYIVSIFGMIDKQKHFQLLTQSMEKFKNYTISF